MFGVWGLGFGIRRLGFDRCDPGDVGPRGRVVAGGVDHGEGRAVCEEERNGDVEWRGDELAVRVLDQDLCLRFAVEGLVIWGSALGCGVWCLGFGVEGLELRV